MIPQIEAFFDTVTGTISYVVYDQPQGRAAIIDPVLGYDAKSGRTQTLIADQLINFIHAQGLTLDWILETHAHADHLSSALYIKQHLGGKIAISERIQEVQKTFKALFNLEEALRLDGSQFDHLFKDGEAFEIGSLKGQVLCVPGHTAADVAYHIGNAVFVGDTLFMPDVGTARCDFPGGNAHTLYQSIKKVLSLPEQTRLFMCHDYPPAHRGPAWECTVADQRAYNIHVHDGIDEAAFVKMRKARDAGLEMPALIFPSLQVNIRAGEMPPPENNGQRYFKIPINQV